MITIAIIDKFPILRMGLAIMLKNNFKEIIILESETLNRFEQYEPNGNPDLFILGYTYDLDINHRELIMKLRNKHPLARIIVYDEYPDFVKVALYWKAGVTGYVSKSSGIPELMKCISEVETGKNYFSNEVMEVLLPKWLTDQTSSRAGRTKLLSTYELDIALSLANGDRITKIALNRDRKVSTISTIKKNIFRKLGINHVTDLAQALRKMPMGD